MVTQLENVLSRSIMNPERVKALNILNTGKVPATEIDQRPGAGGKQFSYIKHAYATRLMQDALGPLWSFECLDYQVFRETLRKKGKVDGEKMDPKSKKMVKCKVDGKIEWEIVSIAARCQLTIKYPLVDEAKGSLPGKFLEQIFTEIGAFEKNEGMNTANGVASAVSRGLLKCLMRALGLGLELYSSDKEELDPKDAWNILKQYLIRRGIEWNDDFIAKFKKALELGGIKTQEDMLDKFTTAYEIANTFITEDDEDIPLEK
jgi:hypothetical protein